MFERFGALGLALDLAPGRGVLAQRLDRDDAEEDGAEPDDEAKPAQIVGEPARLLGEELALLDALAKRLALGADDFLELVVERLARAFGRGLVEIADAGIALLGERGAGGERQLRVALVVEVAKLGDAALLLGTGAHQVAELADLVAGELPVAGVDVAAALDVLVEHEAGERGFGARDVGADVADDQRDFVGMALGGERPLARVVGELDQENHRDQDQRRDQARGRRSAATPVEPDFFVVPIPDHDGQCSPVNFFAKPKGSARNLQLMQPVARPAAANMPRISPTCSSVWSAHSEQRSRVMPAGVAGGRARLT